MLKKNIFWIFIPLILIMTISGCTESPKPQNKVELTIVGTNGNQIEYTLEVHISKRNILFSD